MRILSQGHNRAMHCKVMENRLINKISKLTKEGKPLFKKSNENSRIKIIAKTKNYWVDLSAEET